MRDCPSTSGQGLIQYRALVSKVGEAGAFRMFKYYEELFPGGGEEKALEQFNVTLNPVDAKRKTLEKSTEFINKVEDPIKKTHEYRMGDTVITSLSRKMDTFPGLEFKGPTSKDGWNDSGTDVHYIFMLLSQGVSRPNIEEEVKKRGLPLSVISELEPILAEIQKEGVILSPELILSTKVIPGSDANIAGQSDLVVYTFDGRIIIYDLKTVGVTKKSRDRPELWDPYGHHSQKAKRYTVQTMGYGRMVEGVLHQAVSDYRIIPISVEKEGDDPKGKYVEIKSIKKEGKSWQSVKDWKFEEYADTVLDKMFGTTSFKTSNIKTSFTKETPTYSHLTGDITQRDGNSRSLAENMRTDRRDGVLGYWSAGGKKGTFTPFSAVAQNNREAQLQEIMANTTDARKKLTEDLAFSVKNYLQTQDPVFIDSIGKNSTALINALSPFLGRNDIEIINLNTIPGLNDKKNWLLLKETVDGKDIHHLMYIGGEDLNDSFNTQGFNNTSVFGRHLDKLQSNAEAPTILENKLGDARQFEGTIIATRLFTSIPNFKLATAFVYGVGGNSPYAKMIDLTANLYTISRLKSNTFHASKIFSPEELEMFNQPGVLKASNYKADMTQMVKSYYTQRFHNNYTQREILRGVEDYATDQSKRNELMEIITKHIEKKSVIGGSNEVDYETYLLSTYLLFLQKVDVSLVPVSTWGKVMSMPQNIANPMIQDLNLMLNKSATEMKDEFYSSYKEKFTGLISKLIKEKGSYMRDFTLGDTSRLFDSLYKKVKRRVITDSGIQEKTINAFQFLSETDEDYKKLSETEKQIIETANDIIEKYVKENDFEGRGRHWTRGNIPLVTSTVASRLVSSFKTGGPKGIRDMTEQMFYDLEDSFGTGERVVATSENIFYAQGENDLKDPRLEMMGFSNIDDTVNMEQYQKWSTNIEQIMDVFVIQGLRYKTMNKVGGAMKAATNIFNWHQSKLFDERLDANIDFMKAWYTYNIQNRDVDAGTIANTVTKNLQKYSSLAFIGGNFISASVSLAGNELTIFSQTLANTFSGAGGFGIADMTKAKGIIMRALSGKAGGYNEYDKINLLMDKFRIFNQDITSLLNGYHRETEKTLFRSKTLYALMNGVDWEGRASITIARMINDGSWDAYSVVDGKLVYDETKDDRFNGKGKLKPNEAEALKKLLLEEQGQNENDKLLDGYNINMGTTIRSQVNFILGGFDRETKAMMNAYWWGKMFIAMRNWVPARVDRWFMKPENRSSYGQYIFEQTSDGKTIPIWTGEQMEGTFYSLLAGYNYLKQKALNVEVSPLSSIQKQNISRFIADFIMAGVAMGLYHAIPDDDDDTRLDDATAMIIKRGIDDLFVIYNLLQFDGDMYAPIPLEYANAIIKNLIKTISLQDPDAALKVIPGIAQISKFTEEDE